MLTLGFAVFFFLFLGARPLSNPDEGRYAEIPREMLESRDFVIPRLNGVKYFEKPPLVYWLTSAAFAVVGVNEWSARCWMAVFAVAGCTLTYTAGRWWFGRTSGLWASLVLGTSCLYYGLSRIALLDLVMAVWLTLALVSFLEAMRTAPGRRRRILFWTFYAAMGFGLLTKGLIAFVLPCAVAFFWVLVFNRWRRLRPFYPFSGAALLLGIALPWHVLAARADPSFLNFYFIHEHFQRFASGIHDRRQPWWFFLLVMIGGLFPWIAFAGQSLGLRRWSERSYWRENSEIAFLLIWIAVITLFFSASQSKLIPYILPVFPALALIVGRYVANVWAGSRHAGFRAGAVVLAAIFVTLGAALYLGKAPPHVIFPALPVWRAAVAAVLILGGVCVVVAVMARSPRGALVAIVATTCGLLVSANQIAGPFDLRSTRSLAFAAKSLLRPDDAVFMLGEYFQDFPAYLGRTVDVVDYDGELAFGIHAEPELSAKRFVNSETFRERWSDRKKRAFALLRRSEVQLWLETPGLKFQVIAETPTVILVANGRMRPQT